MFGLEPAENELVYLLHDCPTGGITGGEHHCRTSEKKALHIDWWSVLTLVLYSKIQRKFYCCKMEKGRTYGCMKVSLIQ